MRNRIVYFAEKIGSALYLNFGARKKHQIKLKDSFLTRATNENLLSIR